MRIGVLMRARVQNEELFRFTLEKIREQTYKDWKLFIYRDGGERIDWVKDIDDRIVLAEDDVSRGRAYAGNQCLRMLTDDIDMFTWLDSDGDYNGKKMFEAAANCANGMADYKFWAIRFCRCVYVHQDEYGNVPFPASDMGVSSFSSDKLVYFSGWHPNLVGTMQGLFIPVSAKVIQFDERVEWLEDIGWTRDVENWAMHYYGLWQLNDECRISFVYGGEDESIFGSEPKDYRKKYDGKISYQTIHGDYTSPLR